MTPNDSELEAAADEFEAQLRAIEANSEQIARIEGEARTPDGAVRVRVNAMGLLLDVKLGRTTSNANREWLGRTIVELTAAAAQNAAAQVDNHYAGLRAAQRAVQDRIADVDRVQGQHLRMVSNSIQRPT
ncbi:YbaB/EbfC family nucleoid-associated protein [Nocardia sp. NPDC060259]|uniref:YbaB/EbfC family nucleoid-associated protein n=1 Tax=Nocardia sp. NPDC060259 TaxID=3347088 RepID=UPI0036690EC8